MKKMGTDEEPEAKGAPDGKAFKITPTFRIVACLPEGQSYAIDLARRFGINQ